MPRLVWLAIPDTAAFERPRPQSFADRLIARPPLSGLRVLEHLGALEPSVLLLFLQRLERRLSSRDVFKWLQQTPPHTLTDIQRAARFFYLQQQAFGGKVEGQTWGTATTSPPVNLLRIEENLSAAHLRLTGAYIENLDWYECMERYDRPHTLFYLDPPYWETAGYGVDFQFEQYEKMAELMSRLKGKAILSLNDHPDIRRVFARFQMDSTDINYIVGGGGKGVERCELIIYSWDREAEPAGLF